MYCNSCGQKNPEDAVYCKKCGSLMEAEDETRVAAKTRIHKSGSVDIGTGPSAPPGGGALTAKDDVSVLIFSINPTRKFVFLGYLLAIVAAFVLVALLSVFLPWIGPVPAVIGGLALLIVPAAYHLRKKLVRYTLTDTTIEIDRGLISRRTQNIPLRRVQDVTVTATLFQRILGYGDIEIDNASEDNNRIVLDDIDSPKRYAELILKQMRVLDR